MAADTITVLKSAGPLLTKVFDGEKVIPYDRAKNFSIETLPVSDLKGLSSLLKMLETKGRRCVIRGDFVGDAKAQAIAPPEKPGMYPRLNQLFDEIPHHWMMADIDHYNCVMFDPATEPEEAIREFILDKLPAEFHNASCHWQLSSSAGRTPGMLKCHLWFWLATPYTGPQLKSWVRANALPIDVAPLRKVQVHFCANPVFKNGAIDPVAQRSGLYKGSTDSVDLVIPENLLATPNDDHDTGDLDLVDPTQKPGLIGAFCRAFPISRVLNELLDGEFIFAVGSDRRVTWLNSGGGSPEGCFITDDDWYLGNTHNTDPFDGRLANAWDLVRQYRYGHLDADLTADERAMYAVNELPSQRAMMAWAESLAEIKTEVTTANQNARAHWLAEIRDCADEATLRGVVLPAMVKETSLVKVDIDVLLLAIQTRMRTFTGVRVTAAIARGLLREAGRAGRETVDRTAAPFWAQPFVYVTNGDVFLNTETKERMTKQGFDKCFNRYMAPFANEDGFIPSASQHAPDVWHMDCVANVSYNPTLPRVFEMSGLMYANTYSDANIPAVPPVLTDAEIEACALIESHTAKLLPDPREARLFLDWIAYNVQNPGKKIRWSPFMHGAQRGGKSFYQFLLEGTMGPDNVRPLAATVLIKSDFNEFANEAAVVCIEEIKVPEHSASETDTKLKPLITNWTITIHPKGAKAYPVINVTNYLIFSNYPNGLPLSDEDCRYMVLRAVLSKAEIKALTDSGYYRALYGAVEKYPGALRKVLLERQLSTEFDPDGQAPWTTAKGVAIELCKTETSNVLEDLIKDGGEGITPFVISSNHLTQQAKDKTGTPIYTSSVNRQLTNAGFSFYGRVKWKGEARRVWVLDSFLAQLTGDKESDNRRIREELDASGFDEDFLK